MTDRRIDIHFAAVSAELVHEHQAALPVATDYFLAHRNRYLDDLRTVAELHTRGRILEVGAYPFFFTAMLSAFGLPVVGVDLHPFRALDPVQRYGLEIVACDVETGHLPFRDGTFDLLIFNEILEHLRVDPLFALSEANRVLAPGGVMLLTTPNLYFIKTVLKFLAGRGFNDPVGEFGKLRTLGHMGHVREYAPREVRRFLEASGFTVQHHAFKQYQVPRNLLGKAAQPVLSVFPVLRGYQAVVATKSAAGPGLAPLA